MGLEVTAMKNYTLALRSLESLRDSLARDLRRPVAVELENFSDPIGNVLAAIDRAANLAHLQQTAAPYREVVDALRRIQNGEFGICGDCNEPIAPARIKAVPYARRCIRCQESPARAAA